ncbi:MAG: hypothetical protein Ct9H300mP28_04650 [Pseudomonadota bacterium]|nr:MAG: hypothetical protein Ct9H300mP28_04650 [Pseudomonadota bacterium]
MFERDFSRARRHQKIVEESPSLFLTIKYEKKWQIRSDRAKTSNTRVLERLSL